MPWSPSDAKAKTHKARTSVSGMQRKRASVRLSLDTLAGMLHLREGLTLIGAEYEGTTESVIFYVQGEELPEHSRKAHIQMAPLASLMDWELS